MSLNIKDIKVESARRSTQGDADSVEVKDIGVRLTEGSVVFFDPVTQDQWLVITRANLNTIYALGQVPGLGYITG